MLVSFSVFAGGDDSLLLTVQAILSSITRHCSVLLFYHHFKSECLWFLFLLFFRFLVGCWKQWREYTSLPLFIRKAKSITSIATHKASICASTNPVHEMKATTVLEVFGTLTSLKPICCWLVFLLFTLLLFDLGGGAATQLPKKPHQAIFFLFSGWP